MKSTSVCLTLCLFAFAFFLEQCTTMQDEALVQAKSYYDTVLIKCGGKDYYGATERDYADGDPIINPITGLKARAHVLRMVIHQVRDPEILVASKELTQADKLNGVEWAGKAELRAGGYRTFVKGNWSSWSMLEVDSELVRTSKLLSNSLLEYQPINLTKRHGKWEIVYLGQQFKRPSCEAIPTSSN